MIETSYTPKYYKCDLVNIVENKNGTIFVFNSNGKEIKFDVNQPYSLVQKRIMEILSGKRNVLYLTNNMRDIDVKLKDNGKWELFDEYDIYEFEM